ncbi:proline racemase family protein [Ornithinimicrobium pekingense]|uniref:Proline racemase n=1 Tax=Ornithinimicrobium pekingense TaxID=384677 RepID=A0ABQ2FE60_9MICO|nr:proline racemase family protein [Ornithinimicrobium pekingense]GGK80793.1 proline racemase [Ornithinimicrobium pekingense]
MPPEHRRRIRLVDTHYGGDVSRVVLGGIPRVPGDSVLAKRAWLGGDGDALRRLLLSPPYGEPAMCANVVVDPDLDGADAGYVIMEAMGYPFFSGSNSICVATALLESGYLAMGPPGRQVVHLQPPAGLVRAEVEHDGRHVHAVTVTCDTAWVLDRGRTAELPGFGTVTYDLVWSGCFYAVVDAEAHGFALSEPERPVLADLGMSLCLVASPDLELVHPTFGDTGPLAFVSLAGPLTEGGDGIEVATATYVHPGVVCRCPTGTGTAAQLALLADDGVLGVGDRLTSISPTGSTMVGEIVGRPGLHGRVGTTSTITGRAFTLGVTELVVNLDDDLGTEGIWELLAGTAGP